MGVLCQREAAEDEVRLGHLLARALIENNSVFGGSSGRERRHTVGSRVGGRVRQTRPSTTDAEAAYQFGAVGTADIGAFMVASEMGHTFFGAPASPRLHVGFDYATGDSGLDDKSGATFNQLFPLGHAYFGHIDSVARQNIVDPQWGNHCAACSRPGGRPGRAQLLASE